MNKKHVTPYGFECRSEQDIRSMITSTLYRCQAGTITANHPNNRANTRWSFSDSSNIRQVSSKIRVVSTADWQPFAVAP